MEVTGKRRAGKELMKKKGELKEGNEGSGPGLGFTAPEYSI
jgi:hypothetical protein